MSTKNSRMCFYIVQQGNCPCGITCKYAHFCDKLIHYHKNQHIPYRSAVCQAWKEDVCYFGQRCWFRQESPNQKSLALELVDNFMEMFFDPRYFRNFDRIVINYLNVIGYLSPVDNPYTQS